MLKRPARLFWWVSASVLVLDQVTKSIVRVLWSAPSALIPLDGLVGGVVDPAFGPYDTVPLLGRIFMLTHVRNMGAAFGLLPGYRPVFVLTSLTVLVVVAGYWRKARPTHWAVVLALGLVAGGAVGNLIDRAVLGRVTDFLYFAVIDFPVFNIADSAIVVGVGILIVWLLFGPQPDEEGGAPAAESACPDDISATQGDAPSGEHGTEVSGEL